MATCGSSTGTYSRVPLMLMFNFSGSGCGRSLEECLDHLAPGQKGMPMSSPVFRHHRPDVGSSGFKSCPQTGQHRSAGRRTIHQRDHGGVPAQVQHFLQTHPQRTELTVLGGWVSHQGAASCIYHRRQLSFVIARRRPPPGRWRNSRNESQPTKRSRRKMARGSPPEARAAAPCPIPCARTHPPPVSLRTNWALDSCREDNKL